MSVDNAGRDRHGEDRSVSGESTVLRCLGGKLGRGGQRGGGARSDLNLADLGADDTSLQMFFFAARTIDTPLWTHDYLALTQAAYVPFSRPAGMPVLPTQRSSLCLICAFRTAAWPRSQSLLPHVQIARRTGSARIRKQRTYDTDEALTLSGRFNTLRPGKPRPHAPSVFETVQKKLAVLRAEFIEPEFLDSLSLTREEFDQEWQAFERSINVWVRRSPPVADSRGGQKRLETRLRHLFYAQACGGRFTQAELDNQKNVADLRFPSEWYPATRELSRAVHLHVGPTNSGKTYQALKRLEGAQSGIYLGPLRLLAHEIYTRLNAKGKPCALVTGEEQRLPEGDVKMWSCTVEMAPLNEPMDVAVIDEIQMINHEERGWAWTQAFLGLQAKEVHLCGEARTVPLIRELCALTGDEVHVHEYERLSPLKVADRSLKGELDQLEKGDCVVCFSVMNIHAMRKAIEKRTGKKCAIVYGSLPPETRAQQARLFNDPDNDYDFLVASDAIGMGLNLYMFAVWLFGDLADQVQEHQARYFRIHYEEQWE